jgi:hypothetical protein
LRLRGAAWNQGVQGDDGQAQEAGLVLSAEDSLKRAARSAIDDPALPRDRLMVCLRPVARRRCIAGFRRLLRLRL